uniref:Uncharacterized protein n=1 Tax=Arundo donax TaxID=35708 RepID=A0A0A9FEL1_ARUDO
MLCLLLTANAGYFSSFSLHQKQIIRAKIISKRYFINLNL